MKKNDHYPSQSIKISSFLWVLLVILAAIFYWGEPRREKTGWTACGENPGDAFGTKVAPAGDVNGDGYADVAVWAEDYDGNRGKVYVYWGSAKGLSPTPAWSGQGESKGDEYGHSFGGVGDVNGDGFGDFIVAAQGYGTSSRPGLGKAYLYAGSSGGLVPTPAWTQVGHAKEELFGDCSGPAGDINGDGLPDVIIGAYGFDRFRGAAYLFHGSRTAYLSSQPVWRGEGEAPGDWYGYSVFSIGDVRHDGSTGVLIGAKQAAKGGLPHVGKTYAYYGGKGRLPSKPSWAVEGENRQDLFGWRAISAGDVNGDAFSDVAVAAYSHSDSNCSYCGKVYLYGGSPQGLGRDPVWTGSGEKPGSLFGKSIASGDFNGDGYTDLVVGSPGWEGQRGKIYLFLGGPKGLARDPVWVMEGENTGDNFGAYVANAGDVNRGGFPALLVGAPYASAEGKKSGKAYLFYGGKGGKLYPQPR